MSSVPSTGFGLAAIPTSGLAFGVGSLAKSSGVPTLGSNVSTPSTTSSGATPTVFPSVTGGIKLGGFPTPTVTLPSSNTGGIKLGGFPAPTLSPPSSNPATGPTSTQTIAHGSVLGASLSTGVGSKPSAVTSGFQLSGSSSLPAAVGTATTTSGGSSLSISGIKPVSSATTASTSATTSVTSAASAGPKMTYKELEDQMNKWWMELEHQEIVFLEQATKVNAWDKVLIDNGQKITELNADVEKVKLDQHRLNHELDFIVAQQKELEEVLVPLEESVAKLPPINYQQHTDSERERTYQIAENIDAQLKRMTEDLKEVIDHLNTGSGSQDSSDPMLQISKILNAHMESLQWVDHNAAVLQRKTEEVARYADYTKKEHERNFRLAYS